MVLRALIVEDERMTRETLRTLVPWSRLGVDEVETARDGVDALEKAEVRMPDLVVCDIRMPRMGGLDFARIVRERNPHCGIIFLSGYSDKEYLKAAIRLQAADYLDKPVNLQEVSAAVDRNVRAILARASVSAEAEHARRVLSDLEPLLRQSLAAELVRPGVDAAALRARYDPRILAPFLSGPVRAAALELEAAAGGAPGPARLEEALRALNELAPGAVAAWQAAPDRVGVVLVGVGPAAPSPAGLPASWSAAGAALEARFYVPAQRTLHARGASPAARFPAGEARTAELARLLADGELERASAALAALEARAREAADPDTAQVREAYRAVLALLLQGAPGWEPAEVRVEQERMQEAVAAQRTLAGLAALAESTLRRCYAPGAGRAAAERRIARIREYIRAHHADPDLLVETIAADVGLSESYLCTVFKQACGITVKDHLTRIRIERAKELLRGTGDKLHAVALQVGFRDANYFSTVFKREVGITPREYRERSHR